MNKRQAKLMLKLADYLDAFKEPKKGENGVGFDMGAYFEEDATEGEGLFKAHPCGTAACALGHAGMMPCFNRLGLVTDKKYGDVILSREGEPDTTNARAATAFFDLDYNECDLLFGGNRRTAKQEAKLLRQFVKSKFPELVKPKEKA